MYTNNCRVALLPCPDYSRPKIKEAVERSTAALSLDNLYGSRVLIKPNCISAGRKDGLACTHPEFVAACVEWLVDQGARVTIGDSPAFGTGLAVMEKVGIYDALRGLPVTFASFEKGEVIYLKGGVRINMASEVRENDYLINLPKLKAHSQLYMTMAVKNLFGVIIGLRKPWLHMRYGNTDRFVEMITDLLDQVPPGVSICDGIVAMEREGPLHGVAINCGIIGASVNPIALDTALMTVLGLEPAKSPLWRFAKSKGMAGCDLNLLSFPLYSPKTLGIIPFHAPDILEPIVFKPHRMLISTIRRMLLKWR